MADEWITAAQIEGVANKYVWKYSDKSISTNILYKRVGSRKQFYLTEFPSVKMVLGLEKGDTTLLQSIFVNRGARTRSKICRDCSSSMRGMSFCTICANNAKRLKRKRDEKLEEQRLQLLKDEMELLRKSERQLYEKKLNSVATERINNIQRLSKENIDLKKKLQEKDKLIQVIRREKELIERGLAEEIMKVGEKEAALARASKDRDDMANLANALMDNTFYEHKKSLGTFHFFSLLEQPLLDLPLIQNRLI